METLEAVRFEQFIGLGGVYVEFGAVDVGDVRGRAAAVNNNFYLFDSYDVYNVRPGDLKGYCAFVFCNECYGSLDSRTHRFELGFDCFCVAFRRGVLLVPEDSEHNSL